MRPRRAAARVLAALPLSLLVGGALLLATAVPAAADNCSSPGDCEETAGYTAMIAVVGGIAAVVAAAAALVANAPEGEKVDAGIVQVDTDRVTVTAEEDARLHATAWRVDETGIPKRAGFPLSIEVPAGAPISVTPTSGAGQLLATIHLVEEPQVDEIVITVVGTYKGEVRVPVTVRLGGGLELEIF